MPNRARILLADDEETFLASTSRLFEREGYVCDVASDAAAAMQILQRTPPDVVVADLMMPGNGDLEFVRALADLDPVPPVILVTGFPSLRSAVRSIDLSVAGYVVKPFDFCDLLARVRAAVQRHRAVLSFRAAHRRFEPSEGGAGGLITAAPDRPADTRAQTPVDSFIDLTLHNILGGLNDLRRISEAMNGRHDSSPPEPCHLLQCPRGAGLVDALTDAIDVLERTKGAFKSKELGDLRRRLEQVVHRAGRPMTP